MGMSEIDLIWMAIGLGLCLAYAGAMFALGLAVICKLLNWAPVNVTITMNNFDASKRIVSIDPALATKQEER